jgi:8-amino-7-oxononanoate synthase
VAAASSASLKIISRDSARREQLQRNIEQFKQGATTLALPLMDSVSAIQPLLVGDSARALAISEQLAQRGFLISAIRPPTVPNNSARLRITLSAAHSPQQIQQLLDALDEVMAGVTP